MLTIQMVETSYYMAFANGSFVSSKGVFKTV